jgi:hypothetical protein
MASSLVGRREGSELDPVNKAEERSSSEKVTREGGLKMLKKEARAV